MREQMRPRESGACYNYDTDLYRVFFNRAKPSPALDGMDKCKTPTARSPAVD